MLPIYLASASPRRHEILDQMGITHDILTVPAPQGEDEPRLTNESPQQYVARTAREKALRAMQWVSAIDLPVRPILTADTCVSLKDEILGKPGSLHDVLTMLRQLSGQTHLVQTAVVLLINGTVHECLSTTNVTFTTLTDQEISDYADTNEPWGKAGSYGIQGRAAAFISAINGSYSGVVGLPIFETMRLLKGNL